MKKIIIPFLAAIATFSSCISAVSADVVKDDIPEHMHYHPKNIVGDADGNGVVDTRDATVVLQCIALDPDSPVKTRFDGFALFTHTGCGCLYVAPNGKQIVINLTDADYNGDGFVTEADETLIIRDYNYRCLSQFK